MGVTVNEIARICGVSRTTVLRALNNQSRVSDKTRRQVLEVARELGYRPNLLARSLNTGRTMTLGIVAINMDSLIFVQTLSAINTEAQRKGYSLNIALHGQSSEAEMQRIRDFTDRSFRLPKPARHVLDQFCFRHILTFFLSVFRTHDLRAAVSPSFPHSNAAATS